MIHEWDEEKVVFEVYGTPVTVPGDIECITVDEQDYTREEFEQDEKDPWEVALNE